MKRKENTTLGALRKSKYAPQSIQEEMAKNLRKKLHEGSPTFEGLIGYENTVIPDVERAILSRHNINLLGLRGQAKTRLARQMTMLLDEWVPVVEGSEINDDPFQPISNDAKQKIEELGDKTPVSWLH
ncbi:MAG: magnesium chelatase, partial [Flavobacteriaceae bacterium]|nr:magnesium chelatase [Flavobacteriaceae bacterium]